jgi:hypothetical protein
MRLFGRSIFIVVCTAWLFPIASANGKASRLAISLDESPSLDTGNGNIDCDELQNDCFGNFALEFNPGYGDNTTYPPYSEASSDDGHYNYQVSQKSDRWIKSVDILAAAFFLVAAAWLSLVILYSVMIVLILRMQARGEVDIYDDDFGRIFCFNRRFSVHLGCILRRYAIRLEQEGQQRSIQREGGGSHQETRQRVRIMTRLERRMALEAIFAKQSPASFVISVEASENTEVSEGPICAICLGEYGECVTDSFNVHNILKHTM